jgi:hypothetical protein
MVGLAWMAVSREGGELGGLCVCHANLYPPHASRTATPIGPKAQPAASRLIASPTSSSMITITLPAQALYTACLITAQEPVRSPYLTSSHSLRLFQVQEHLSMGDEYIGKY